MSTHEGSSANGRFSFPMSYANDSKLSNARRAELQLVKRRMTRFRFEADQNLDVEKIDCRST
jgi:hypothetical protein